MIKSISLSTRKDGTTHEQFVDHWTRIHGPLAHAVPGIRRYVQSHIVDERRRADIPALDVDIDGIAEPWFDDRDAMKRAFDSPRGQGALRGRCALHRPHQGIHGRGARDRQFEAVGLTFPPLFS